MNPGQDRQKGPSRQAQNFSGAEWSSLERRLCETKDLLKEILSNLQLVLANLRGLNRRFSGYSQNRPGPGPQSRETPGYSFSKNTTPPPGASAKTGPGAAPGASGHAGTGANKSSAFTGRAHAGAEFRKKNPYARPEGHGEHKSRPSGARENTRKDHGPTGGAHKKTQNAGPRGERRRPPRTHLGEMTLERARLILCVPASGRVTDLKSAYRKKARQFHPDLGGDEEMMKDLNIAYDLLMRFHFDHEAPTERSQ